MNHICVAEDVKSWLLMKCFAKDEYRKDFTNGTNIRINSVDVFREEANKFQGDVDDCVVVCHDDPINGSFYTGSGHPIHKLADATLDTFALNCYVSCYFALPKDFFYVKDGILYYDTESKYFKDFYLCLNEYYKAKSSCFVAIYDAYELVNRLISAADNCGYAAEYGLVNYTKIGSKDRLKLFAENKISDITLIKNPLFSYQREFRMIIREWQKISKFIELKTQNNNSILAMKFDYCPCEKNFEQA